MIETPVKKIEGVVAAALADHSRYAECMSPGRWSLGLREVADSDAEARLDGDWLTLSLSLPWHGPLWDALCAGSNLRGPCKLVAPLHPGMLGIAADIPLVGLADGALGARVAEALRGLALAHVYVCGEGGQPDPTGESAEQTPAADLPALLAESGWAATMRPSGAAAVRLDVPGEFCQALVEQEQPTGALRARVDLGTGADLSEVCREATALLMLRTAAITRLARARACMDEQNAPVGFAVTLLGPATSAEVGHALAALSVACRLCRRELAVLRDESVARDYLSVCGRAT